MRRSSLCFSAWLTSRRAYSRPASGSWMEHGPTITSRRSSTPSIMARTSSRPRSTTSAALASSGSSAIISCGVGRAVISLTRRFDVDWRFDAGCWVSVAVALMFGVRSGWERAPDQNPPWKWRRAENDLCPVGSEGKLDACQLDAGPSRANEKYAYQRLVMGMTINPPRWIAKSAASHSAGGAPRTGGSANVHLRPPGSVYQGPQVYVRAGPCGLACGLLHRLLGGLAVAFLLDLLQALAPGVRRPDNANDHGGHQSPDHDGADEGHAVLGQQR